MLRFANSGLIACRGPLFARDDVISRDHWAEYEDDVTRLDAVITDIYINGTDPTLQVRASDGVNWTVELAGHARNREVGLEDANASPGDSVIVWGRQTHHFGETRIKALKIAILDRVFDLFPDQSPPA
ncbi:hypothetical protein PAF17_03860 [Paracoccus sp. Z330]|uniref:Uncharacterized protein n=1 Tax=Paracoccus onchidii TaxID=3017813 RepID=A0ABT4ZBA4_9RHOB|nr:hypothetical protein [Paracoccus onchidii]MDB6176638.1 hypothetical protein [Paracoccus onchidii]